MNRVIAYSLLGIGMPSFLFFLYYRGSAIPLPALWWVLSLFMLLAGGFFWVRDTINQPPGNDRQTDINQLKATGEKIRITPDNAAVKTRTYLEDISHASEPSRTQMLDALYDSNRNYKTREVRQTYIVFVKQFKGKTYEFISQATMQEASELRSYIDRQQGVDLYIDPQHPDRYYFDLPF